MQMPNTIWVRFGDTEPRTIRKWAAEPFDGAVAYTRVDAPEAATDAAAALAHNDAAKRLVHEMWESTGNTTALNILAESLLLAAGMLNFPSDPRRQAMIIQEIADGAQDRAKAVRP